jgi:hypothetical protein
MANLKMAIKVREKTGSRRWLDANEKSVGSFYIQWCMGSKAKPIFVGTSYDEAFAVTRWSAGAEKYMANKDRGLPMIPRTPPGFKPTGNLLSDLNKMYGSAALRNGKVRATIRRKYKGTIEVAQIDGEWCIVQVQK